MKTIEAIFQDTQIHFLLQNEGDVMVNATEMANAFGKRVDHFMRSDHAKEFIKVLLSTPFGGDKNILPLEKIHFANKKAGTFMHRVLALKFAAWLDPAFELWVYSTIDNILFGQYKNHWDAHARQEQAKEEMAYLKQVLLANPDKDSVFKYFEAEKVYKEAKNAKTRAITNQLRMFDNPDTLT